MKKNIKQGDNYMENKSIFIHKSELLKALAHPTRLCIVKGLMEKASNVSNIQECLDLPQSTVSQHLFKLKAAGIIKGKRKGLEISYQVINDDIRKIIKVLFP
jgi:DNA-binding transcriptional ArsR family regulator